MSAVHDGRCSPWVMCSMSEWPGDSGRSAEACGDSGRSAEA